jgi:hypothetical protein
MGKKSTLCADNVYYQSRINAGITSRDTAEEHTGIDASSLALFESYQRIPSPENILKMENGYNDYELHEIHCSHICPLGARRYPKVGHKPLQAALLDFLHRINIFNRVEGVRDVLVAVTRDGIITADEYPLTKPAVIAITEVEVGAKELKMSLTRNGFNCHQKENAAHLRAVK